MISNVLQLHIAPVPPVRRPNKKALKKLAAEKAAQEAEKQKKLAARKASTSWLFFWRKPQVQKLDEQGK